MHNSHSDFNELSKIIQVNNLSFSYGNSKALDSVTLPIFSNQVTAVIGPSGCGKSTFIKALKRSSISYSNLVYQPGCCLSRIMSIS